MLNSLVLYTKAALGMNALKRETFCDCKASVQYSEGRFISDCVAKSTCLALEKFYGRDADSITNGNCHDVKASLAAKKRNCLMCEYFNVCPGFCSASVLFVEYHESECPIRLLYRYIAENKSRVTSDFNDYCSKYKLPEQMLDG